MAIWFLGSLLLAASLGVLVVSKPVHACLSFLGALIALAALYLQLSANFIAVMQVLVYAGAILVIFMFVIILFQDAHAQLAHFAAKSFPPLLYGAGIAFLVAIALLAASWMALVPSPTALPHGFGSVEALGRALYVDFFFPFEVVVLLFLIALVGTLYTGRKSL
jgi:NADH-quinone oxidoreductase subunit J